MVFPSVPIRLNPLHFLNEDAENIANFFWEKTHGQRQGEKKDGKSNDQKPVRRSLTDFVNVVQPK